MCAVRKRTASAGETGPSAQGRWRAAWASDPTGGAFAGPLWGLGSPGEAMVRLVHRASPMSSHRNTSRLLVAGLLLALLVPTGLVAASGDPQTRAQMHALLASLRVLLPLSVDEARLADPKERPRVEEALSSLAGHAQLLATHVKNPPPDFALFGRNLAEDARTALVHFRRGAYDSAGFTVREMTDSCVACHARLPAKTAFLGEALLDRKVLLALPPADRAQLYVATRQFDDALKTWERLFQDPARPTAELQAPLTEYLVTSVRVRNDLLRPLPVLEQMARRPDAWGALKEDLLHWGTRLRALSARPPAPGLEGARALLDEARQKAAYPADRRGLIDYIVASSVLEQHLEAAPRGPGLAEAYYLRGLAEIPIRESYWVSSAEYYLESAVRAGPRTRFARLAYDLLESQLILENAGSEGAPLLPEDRARLETLRRLLR